MKINLFHNSKPRTDQGETLGKNPWENGLVGPAREFPISVIKTSSKVTDHKSYDEIDNDPIYENGWCEALNEEL